MGDADELVFHWSNHPLVEHSTHSTNQTTSRWRPLIVRILRRSPSGRQPIAVRPGLAAVTLRQIGEVLQTFILQITFLMKAERLLTQLQSDTCLQRETQQAATCLYAGYSRILRQGCWASWSFYNSVLFVADLQQMATSLQFFMTYHK